MEGDSDIIWGLLQDIWRYYSGKAINSKKSNLDSNYIVIENNEKLPLSSNGKLFKNSDTTISYEEEKDVSYLLNTGLPYRIEELKMLEESLILWLETLGIVNIKEKTTLLDIEKNIMNGYILCELSRIFTKNNSLHNNIPKTRTGAFSNIRKALETFRKLPGMNHQYLWSENEIYKGDRGVILGLLQDLHRYYDGIIADPNDPNPYLGKPTNGNTLLNKEDEFAFALAPSPDPYPMKTRQSSVNINPIQPPSDNYPLPDVITSWINRVLAPIIRNKKLVSITADSFKDGVLLSQLIATLERKKIEGINPHPKTSAAILHNIRQLLNVLKNKKNISLEYLYSEQEIRNGNYNIIFGLIKNIKYVYHSIQWGNGTANTSTCSAKSFGKVNTTLYLKKQQIGRAHV